MLILLTTVSAMLGFKDVYLDYYTFEPLIFSKQWAKLTISKKKQKGQIKKPTGCLLTYCYIQHIGFALRLGGKKNKFL